ncbi:MAG: phosphatidylglycerophosphatase A [Candidatus Goldiibacteriota bacterium HGW-Goldbacteria-1]|jgi:phosphatidylglycerophosphatase A|nr:MAG: phosphatidylglycerophosphatase A [Candidatus Goldiibacteriota bacterium HGW-Goldbacteria-1]
MRQLIIIFTSFFYTGYAPKASGTVATLAFLPVYWFFLRDMHPAPYVIITVILVLAGIWASNYAIVIHGKKDPSRVVIDEVAGYMVTMMFIPYTDSRMIIGFFASRVFDILKIFPARQSEALPGGTGIMIDDVIAGIQANIFMWAVIYFKLDLPLQQLITNVIRP